MPSRGNGSILLFLPFASSSSSSFFFLPFSSTAAIGLYFEYTAAFQKKKRLGKSTYRSSSSVCMHICTNPDVAILCKLTEDLYTMGGATAGLNELHLAA